MVGVGSKTIREIPLANIKERTDEPFFESVRFGCIKSDIILLTQCTGNTFHLLQSRVMPGVRHYIIIGKSKSVVFSSLLLSQTEYSGMRPVHDIPYLSLKTDRTKEIVRLQSGRRADQPVLLAESHQDTRFQQFVTGFERTAIARIQIIVPGYRQRLQDPFGRPCRILQQVFMRATGNRIFTIHPIVAKLVDQGIRLIRNTFAVAIYINPGE